MSGSLFPDSNANINFPPWLSRRCFLVGKGKSWGYLAVTVSITVPGMGHIPGKRGCRLHKETSPAENKPWPHEHEAGESRRTCPLRDEVHISKKPSSGKRHKKSPCWGHKSAKIFTNLQHRAIDKRSSDRKQDGTSRAISVVKCQFIDCIWNPPTHLCSMTRFFLRAQEGITFYWKWKLCWQDGL